MSQIPHNSLHANRVITSAGQSKLRVLQRGGFRAAIKLEAIFWSQLDELAHDGNTTTSKLVFELLDQAGAAKNKTAVLRCYCLDRARVKSAANIIQSTAFDLLGIVAACPVPVAVITAALKIAAYNPSFSSLINNIREAGDGNNAIQFSFGEAVPKIILALITEPNRIPTHQIGIQVGRAKPKFFYCRFALVDRSKGSQSNILLFFENATKSLEQTASS